MTNKISIIVDASIDKAVSGFKGFKSSIMDADGAVGKFKAGASSAFDSIKGQAGNMAMVAGAALVAFGVKAVTAFQDSALGAGKFADATGLSTETASRWIAVADDIGISAETMEKSFGKLAVSVGKNNPLLEQYGITVRKGADGQDDMNATMLHAVDVIKSIQDPTKKAAVAQAALGKGWMDMAELIQQGSGSLTTSMAAVSEAQVIDPEEVEKARKMRESMDNLQDAVRDLALVMGEDLVPMVAAVAEGLVKLIGPLQDANQWSKNVALSIMDLTGIIEDQKDAIDPLIFGYGVMVRAGEDYQEMARGVIDSTAASTAAIEAETDATKDAAKGTNDFSDALQANLDALTDATNARRAAADATFALHDAEKTLAESLATVDERLADAEGNLLEQRQILEGVAQNATAVADAQVRIAVETATANGAVMTAKQQADLFRASLQAQADQLSGPSRQAVLDYIASLNEIPRTITTRALLDTGGVFRNARGTSSSPGGLTLVGEEGPELVNMPRGAQVFTAGQTRSMLNGGGNGHSGGAPINITVNAGMGADGREIGDIIVGKIREYERRNGTGWRDRVAG